MQFCARPQIADEGAERGNNSDKVVISMDNQAAIGIFKSLAGSSGTQLVAEAINRINKLHNGGIQIEIRWLLTHTGI